jgi:hypothetical protein
MLALLPALAAAAAFGASATLTPAPPPRIVAPISAAQWQPRPGDLIFLASEDIVGDRIRAASGDQAIYSHVGIVVARAGILYVLDVTPFGSGKVQYNDIAHFTTDPATTDLLILRPRARLDEARLNAEAERLAGAGIAFDYGFDMEDGSELYCAELVYNLLGRSGLDLRSVQWTEMYVPLVGNRNLVTPDALVHAPIMGQVWRRRADAG